MFCHNQFLLYPRQMEAMYMNDITYTHKELAALVNVSETTIKSYRKKIPNCLPISNTGKPIRFSQDALEVCKRIKELFSEGMAVVDVQKRLSEEYEWIEKPSERRENIAHETTHVADVAIPLNAIAQGVMNILQQQKDVMRKLKELEDTISSMQVHTQSEVVSEREEHKGVAKSDSLSTIPEYLMGYPLVVETSQGDEKSIEGLGLLPQFTIFDLVAKLNYNFKYPEHYVASTSVGEQIITITFMQEQAEHPQSFSIELFPIQHKGHTVLLVVGFYIDNKKTPVETLMSFIHL